MRLVADGHSRPSKTSMTEERRSGPLPWPGSSIEIRISGVPCEEAQKMMADIQAIIQRDVTALYVPIPGEPVKKPCGCGD
jgi:hypothetical protein